MQAVNDVLDTHVIRITVINDRIPFFVFILLLLIAAWSLAVAAYNAGLNGSMNRWRMGTFAVVLVALILVIVDFDRPKSGFIRVSNRPIELVIRDMQSYLAD